MNHIETRLPLPIQPIDRWLRPFARFLHIEATSGLVLILCTVVALVAANSSWADSYLAFWHTDLTIAVGDIVFHHSLHHVINDGLMAVFFFVIGLEVKRELAHGSLSDLKQATLPIAAAIGGMIVPATLYLSMQYGQPGVQGWGIPMATDIAFVVGCLAILGSRVPHSLRVLLLSLAIVDDIGAILVIAIGYTESLDGRYLFLAAVAVGAVHFLSRIGVRRFPPYVIVGVLAWIALHESGIHATLIGVILGLMTPATPTLVPERFREYLHEKEHEFQPKEWSRRLHRAEVVREVQQLTRETVSPLEYLEVTLHPWTAYVIMPVFALANAGVLIEPANLSDSVAIAVVIGLVVGKPLGIALFSWLVIRLGVARLPSGLNWPILMSGSFLAGIGFTMALFIDGLAFGADGLDTAKTGVLVGSAISAIAGMGLLLWTLPKPTRQ
ncbi:MAG TPA: Na+/H+ antiporter NhaA [Rhodopirellula baltica]|uniref:Na(+)/H(+) antiporter NhaA n=1 Tax=Rhodopirellula baltica (strain DSM 10527 / NCIMB 13988 / SH1) TaxID=243090 RepID=NHAA_RHOBA|nr:Na+/H+ antiporter NhaA [Rhodopirellula baltica]Q7UTY3.1 RecName: Full=Na(+)/H(+) antiporter NhaA; AltName: Full=Sodium/proton antiporter NhaA [Rhodopirellula baltica SH 1]CAD73301.1 Na(+)/H(+) antiporter 1 [Rhodopirellula baltica SH 1]HBE62962.1 Na+/H+ antiporter NhaA [Rhodopirellula baltica]